ncbi:hypothetical protein [uncultured Lacinutrix sp.]|uniref:hypothetical protein n=1 Tax=uncultured Lacinutrix sp. TaxID=574032 RepID=UPI00260F9DBA|nr:hypothetical protein [uncultured Lacinutrix sp.]
MKTYYNDSPRKVTFESKSISLSNAKDYFLALSDHKKSYIGFIDVYYEVIIFNFHKRNKWLVEHLVVPNTLHRQRYATNEDCIKLIEKVYQEYDISTFKGFEDVPIGEFTLDEILAFKQEDEMLLREEDSTQIAIPKSKPTPKKKKAKTSIQMGETLNVKTTKPETIIKEATKKIIKDKPVDNNSFFQL